MQRVYSEVTAEEKPTLRPVLRYRDVVLFYIILVFGYRQVVQAAGMGPAIVPLLALGFVIFFLPQALTVAELSSRYPSEGGIYVWTKRAFGNFHAFMCA